MPQVLKISDSREVAHLLADGAMAAAISKAVRPLPGDVASDTSLCDSCRLQEQLLAYEKAANGATWGGTCALPTLI